MKLPMKTTTVFSALFILCCLAARPASAMPSKEELSKAEPLVQEVMKSEMEALRLNKKTRAQVGAAAFALAKEAQAPAEKYLLLTGAFEQSLRGGAYDEALAALDELKRAIPDFPEKDEFALLDKAVRSISSSKGDALRERHATLAKRINNRARLEKLLEQSKKAPADKPLHFRVATYRVYFDDWASALDEFELSDNASCAAAAKAEKDASTPKSKVADLWWDATPLKPDFLTTALRAHAVSLYRTALSDNTLTGLQRIAAEKRVKEHEAELAAAAAEKNSATKKAPVDRPYDEELEYLESDGGQWLETGFSLPEKGRYSIEIKVSYLPSAPEMDFWGNFGLDKSILVGQFGGLVFGYNKGAPRIDGKPEKVAVTHVIKLEINGGKRSLFVDGACIGSGAYVHSGEPLCLFAGGKNYKCARVKIHYFKIQRDGRAVLDMIPVMKEGTPFMYDKVSKKMRAGSGARKLLAPAKK